MSRTQRRKPRSRGRKPKLIMPPKEPDLEDLPVVILEQTKPPELEPTTQVSIPEEPKKTEPAYTERAAPQQMPRESIFYRRAVLRPQSISVRKFNPNWNA